MRDSLGLVVLCVQYPHDSQQDVRQTTPNLHVYTIAYSNSTKGVRVVTYIYYVHVHTHVHCTSTKLSYDILLSGKTYMYTVHAHVHVHNYTFVVALTKRLVQCDYDIHEHCVHVHVHMHVHVPHRCSV